MYGVPVDVPLFLVIGAILAAPVVAFYVGRDIGEDGIRASLDDLRRLVEESRVRAVVERAERVTNESRIREAARESAIRKRRRSAFLRRARARGRRVEPRVAFLVPKGPTSF